MNVAFKNSFLKSLQKLKDEDLKEAIIEVIAEIEQSDKLTEISNLKKRFSDNFNVHVDIAITLSLRLLKLGIPKATLLILRTKLLSPSVTALERLSLT